MTNATAVIYRSSVDTLHFVLRKAVGGEVFRPDGHKWWTTGKGVRLAARKAAKALGWKIRRIETRPFPDAQLHSAA